MAQNRMETPEQKRRLELDSLLTTILGSENVYFQEPGNDGMQYPAIIYKWDDEYSSHADNQPYRRMRRYTITVIDKDPDSSTPDKIAALPRSSFSRRFVVDQLNHTIYSLYF